jgi:hypothetical protein
MGMSRWKFYVWAIFRIVEPIAAVLGAFAVTFTPFYPMLWLLRQVP